jgi:hypothetical protein
MTDKHKVHVIINNPYTNQTYENNQYINDSSLNEILEEINNLFPIVENTGISIYDDELNLYIYCGNYPLNTYIAIPQKQDTVTI